MISSLALLAAVAAAPVNAPPVAPLQVDSYRVVVRGTSDDTRVLSVRGEDVRAQIVTPGMPASVFVGGTEFVAAAGGRGGSILRAQYADRPEGFPRSADRSTETVASILGRARSGELALISTTLEGRPALRATVALPANDCAALGPRRATVWLSPTTLMPLLILERTPAGRTVQRVTYSYRMLNATFPGALFTPPATAGPGRFVASDGFRRVSPTVAAASLPYVPRVPAVLPDGFRLVVSGWAPRSGSTGPEASIPRSPSLFTAVYRRGQERIVVSQRAGASDWPGDPFGHECGAVTTSNVTVAGVAATYGIGPEITPHLFWRDGAVRYTVSGPLSKDGLLAVAGSLTPVR